MVVHGDDPSKLGNVYGASIDSNQASLGGLYSTSPTHKRQGSIVPIVEELDFEQTVRGSHHWVGVMRDWNWEGKYNTKTHQQQQP